MSDRCDALRTELAEALTGERPMTAALRDHASACAGCSALAHALRGLADGAAPAQDAPYWRDFESSLRRRMDESRGRARFRRPRAWLLAAAIAAAALALFLLRPRGPAAVAPEGVARTARAAPAGAAPPEAAPPEAAEAAPSDAPPIVLAAASADGLDSGLQSLGFEASDAGDAPAPDTDLASAWNASAPPPAWGDVVNELGDELSSLDADAQAELARALREAT